LEAKLAVTADPVAARRLHRLLGDSVGDEAALIAASALAARSGGSLNQRWRVARALFVHGQYERAAPVLEELAQRRWSKQSRAAFLRGRCAFRLDRWAEAAGWYARAVAGAGTRDERADLLSHLARSQELAGDLDGALGSVRRAVGEVPSDRFRLHVIRLLLVSGSRDGAQPFIEALESRDARARAEVLRGLDDLRQGDVEAAARKLARVPPGPWLLPSRVLAARLTGDEARASELLAPVCSASETHRYWLTRARAVLRRLPGSAGAPWRARCAGDAAASAGAERFAVVSRWAAAEPDPARLETLRKLVAEASTWAPVVTAPEFAGELARTLWQLGLTEMAARWDPRGFPRATDGARAWSADRLVATNASPAAMLAVDRIWRGAGGGAAGDHRLLPSSLRHGLYPLPWPDAVIAAAASAGIDPALLAALAREESRWDPRARSAVGARGLTQLMPATASRVAAGLGRPPPTPEELLTPEVALQLGAAELATLLERFDGRVAVAVAAYNAGPEQASSWLDQCGATYREEQYLMTVTFAATRAYTERVLASRELYLELYPKLRSVDDP
jgi:soluble lytic murein transglycosylase-like protein